MSVLIPAWNAEATIARAIRSVEGAAEVLVVDDGSTDGTAARAEALGARVVRHSGNRGSSAALTTAIAEARHEVIAFLDADDAWLPGKLAAQLPLLGEDTAFVATGFETVDSAGRLLFRYGPEGAVHEGRDFWKALLAHSHVAKPTVLTRRSAVTAAGGFDPALAVAEDQDLWIRLARRGPVRYVPDILTRVHAGAGLSSRHARADLRYVLPMVERHIAAERARLTAREIQLIRRTRWAAAARNLVAERAFGPALSLGWRAVRAGEPAAPLARALAAMLVRRPTP